MHADVHKSGDPCTSVIHSWSTASLQGHCLADLCSSGRGWCHYPQKYQADETSQCEASGKQLGLTKLDHSTKARWCVSSSEGRSPHDAHASILRRNMFDNLSHSVADECLEPARISIQPREYYSAVSPCMNVMGRNFKYSLDIDMI